MTALRAPRQRRCRLHQPISAAPTVGPGQPRRAELRSPRSGTLDRPTARRYPSRHGSSTINHTQPDRPVIDTDTGCELLDPISAKTQTQVTRARVVNQRTTVFHVSLAERGHPRRHRAQTATPTRFEPDGFHAQATVVPIAQAAVRGDKTARSSGRRNH